MSQLIYDVIMSTNENGDNDVNETRSNNGESVTSSRYPAAEQRNSGRHSTTAKVKRNKELNKMVMECYLRQKACLLGTARILRKVLDC